MWRAQYFDGLTSKGQVVDVNIADGLKIYAQNGDLLDHWQSDDFKVLTDDASLGTRLEQKSSAARISFLDHQADIELRTIAPLCFKRRYSKREWRKLLGWSFGAFAALGLIIFVLLPNLSNYLAKIMPRDQEVELGHKLVNSMGSDPMMKMMGDMRRCEGEAGTKAIYALFDNLKGDRKLDYEIELYIVNSDLSNAFTLPGGQIVFLNGLLQKAKSPEEVGAVLAHEIGHAEARDPLRMLFGTLGRSSILSLLLGDMTGGIIGYAAIDQLVNAAYSQAAESDADDYAVALLNENGVGTEPLAGFFEGLSKEFGDSNGFLAHFASHPELANRAKNARDQNKFSAVPTKLLDDEQWADLKAVCDDLKPLPKSELTKLLESVLELDEQTDGEN